MQLNCVSCFLIGGIEKLLVTIAILRNKLSAMSLQGGQLRYLPKKITWWKHWKKVIKEDGFSVLSRSVLSLLFTSVMCHFHWRAWISSHWFIGFIEENTFIG